MAGAAELGDPVGEVVERGASGEQVHRGVGLLFVRGDLAQIQVKVGEDVGADAILGDVQFAALGNVRCIGVQRAVEHGGGLVALGVVDADAERGKFVVPPIGRLDGEVKGLTDQRAHHIIDGRDSEVDLGGGSEDVQQNLVNIGWLDVLQYISAEAEVEALGYWIAEVVLAKAQPFSKLCADPGIKAVGSKIDTSNGNSRQGSKAQSRSSSSAAEVAENMMTSGPGEFEESLDMMLSGGHGAVGVAVP